MRMPAVMFARMAMLMCEDMHAQIDTKADKQCCGYVAYPLFYAL